MRKFLLALGLTLIAGFAHAACPVPNPNINAPPWQDGCLLPAASLNRISAGVPINSTATGTNAYTITPSTGLVGVTPADGTIYAFVVPNATVATASNTVAVTAAVTGFSGGPWPITRYDGFTILNQTGDLVTGERVVIRFNATTNVFQMLTGAPAEYENVFTTGNYQLQASSSSLLTVDPAEIGGSITAWNSTLGTYQKINLALSGKIEQELFNGTALVNGAANQTLSNNTLYGVFMEPVTGPDPSVGKISFYAFAGTYYIDGSNIPYVLTNGITADRTRVFAGLVWTGGGTISSEISPAGVVGNSTYTHSDLDRWRFGFQSTQVSANPTISSSAYTTLSTPSVYGVTEGLTDTPVITAHIQAKCVTNPHDNSFELLETYNNYLGASGTSVIAGPYVMTTAAGATTHLTMSWASAPPFAKLQFQIMVKSDASANADCTFVSDMLGVIPQ